MCCVRRRESTTCACLLQGRFTPPPFPPPPSAVAVAGERGDEKYQEYFNLFGSEEDVETTGNIISQRRKDGRIFETKANIPCIKNDFLCVKVGVYCTSLYYGQQVIGGAERTNERYDTLQTTSAASSFIRRRPPFSSSPPCLPSPPRKGSEQ